MSEHTPLPSGPSPRSPDHAGSDGGGLSAEARGERRLRLEVFRYDAASSAPPRFQAYEVAATDDSTLLSVLLGLQEEPGSLAGFSLLLPRPGVRLLRHGRQWPADAGLQDPGGRSSAERRGRASAGLRSPQGPRRRSGSVLGEVRADSPLAARAEDDAPGEPRMEPPVRDRIDPYSHCILCALCYAACPAVSMHEGFTGPGSAGQAVPVSRRSSRPPPPGSLAGRKRPLRRLGLPHGDALHRGLPQECASLRRHRRTAPQTGSADTGLPAAGKTA